MDVHGKESSVTGIFSKPRKEEEKNLTCCDKFSDHLSLTSLKMCLASSQ
jgi:hypothetical protein